jgi:hypothetical protein
VSLNPFQTRNANDDAYLAQVRIVWTKHIHTFMVGGGPVERKRAFRASRPPTRNSPFTKISIS